MSADVLFEDVGEWDAEVEVRPTPGAAPVRSKGVWSARRVGAFLVVDYRADSGFEGHGVYGFDGAKYTGIWVDAASPAMAHLEGTYDLASRTMTYVCETVVRGKPFRYRELTERRADGTRVYRNLMPTEAGSEHELLRIVYTRR